MGSEQWLTFEIFELIVASLLLIVVGGTMIFIGNPDLVKAKTLSNEISYVGSLISEKDAKIKVNIDSDIKVNIDENNVVVELGENKVTKSFIGSSSIENKIEVIKTQPTQLSPPNYP